MARVVTCPTCRRPLASASGFDNHVSKCCQSPEVPVPLEYSEVCELAVLCHMLSPFSSAFIKDDECWPIVIGVIVGETGRDQERLRDE